MNKDKIDSNLINQRQLFGWLWKSYLQKHGWLLTIVIILMAVEGSMIGGLAWMMQPLFDNVFVGGSYTQLWGIAAIVLSLFLARGILSVSHRVMMIKIARHSVADLQNDLLNHLLLLDMEFFSRNAPGYLIERVQGDVQSVAQTWGLVVRGGARDLI